MKKLVQINVTCNGSTGRIMEQIQKKAIEEGYEAYSFYGRGKPSNDKCIKIDRKIEVLWHVFISRIFNMQGHGSILATYRLIRKIKKINPDIIHLHNLHGYYLNYKILFKYLQKSNQDVVWTLHDCWSFTGHCTYYTYNKCDKWKNENCIKCKYSTNYPRTFFFKNRSSKEYNMKKKMFTSIKNLKLTVPSNWMKKQVEMSFLKGRNIEVIHNFIDLDVFKPTLDDSIKNKYHIEQNKKIILGVAAQWTISKGIEYFKALSKIIDNEKETIVMVGLSDKQIKSLPSNITGIKKTENIEELVKIYSMADVLFNPSIQETFSMVTLEAMACGLKCVVFNSTATPELINNNTGKIIKKFDLKNIKEIYKEIKEILYNKDKNTSTTEQAKKYDIKRYKEYLNIYNKIIERKQNK